MGSDNFLYSLDSSEKFECPECHQNTFVRYKNNSLNIYLEGDYGRCDREVNCGYHRKPEDNRQLNISQREYNDSINIFDCDYIPLKFIERFQTNEAKYENPFLRGLVAVFGKEKVMTAYKQYKLGTWHGGATLFPYIIFDLHTAKLIWYNNTLHRIKEGSKGRIQWLHNAFYRDEDGQTFHSNYEGLRTWGFFGEHLLHDDSNRRLKTFICIVESEKTAVIMSMIFPEYIWLATGGLRNLNKNKFFSFQSTRVLVFPDMGINKVEKISVRDLWRIKMNEALEMVNMRYAFVNYVPHFMYNSMRDKWEDEGKDVADFVFEYSNEYIEDGSKGEFKNYVDYLKTVIDDAKQRL